MKRKFTIFFLMLIAANCFAQKVEIIGKYPFGNPVEYTEEWDPNEGCRAGITNITVWNNNFLILNRGNYYWKYSWVLLNNLSQQVKFNGDTNAGFFYSKNGILTIGQDWEKKEIYIYTNSENINKPDYIIDLDNDYVKINKVKPYTYYFTDNKFFLENVYWELLPGGETKFHNEQQCKAEMEEGLEEKLGIIKDGNSVYFGDTCTTFSRAPGYRTYFKDIKIVSPNSEYLKDSIGIFVGTDKHGITYSYRYTNTAGDKCPAQRNPNFPITLSIIALDPWTHEAYVLKLPEGSFNPPRNEDGLIANCSQCIDKEGNYYFTDCNKAEGCYELKKVSNEWIKQYDFYNRKIGIMNANHIPLQNEASLKAENNGYNFDNEYLWILEKKKAWCRVRKVDGREGWVESKYITFDDGKSDVPFVNSKTERTRTES